MLNIRQTQQLRQKLSPQQIQYIRLLQLPILALDQRIEAELEANPLLERSSAEKGEMDNADADSGEEGSEEEFDWEEFLNNSDDLYGYKARVESGQEEDREISVPATETTADHLRRQVALQDFTETERLIAEQIIGSIDEDGYLHRSLESIVDDLVFTAGITLEATDVEDVLKRIQRMDPVGIGSRDLRECLLVQLHSLPAQTTGRDVAVRMLEEVYEAFAAKHFDSIKRKLRVSNSMLKEAYDLIVRLDPKPGDGALPEQHDYITPDFTVEYVDGEFVVTLNRSDTPPLRISREYYRMLQEITEEGRKRAGNHSEIDERTRRFLKNRLESARWFIHSINQRRRTMARVMHAIVQLQEGFFKYGERHLRPMVLNDVAEIISMDISTVSRVVKGKYVQTGFGMYPLKHFFSEGLETKGGEEVSNKEVKAMIDSIIEGEDKAKPFSDERIAARLACQGLRIARRTVSKYREQMGIPVARLRREIVLG